MQKVLRLVHDTAKQIWQPAAFADKAGKEVAYPFGHGLSYTDFEYSDMTLSATELNGQEELSVRITGKNAGSFSGKEIVQLYIAAPDDGIFRPMRELRAFEKVSLAPGESQTVTMTLSRRAFSYYDAERKDWRVDSGEGMDEFTKIIDAMLEDMPIRQLAMMSGGALTPSIMAGLVEMMNGHYIRGVGK